MRLYYFLAKSFFVLSLFQRLIVIFTTNRLIMELSEHVTDARLIELISQDNSFAFRRLYERYWLGLFDKARKRVDEDTAKDIIQEVMTTLWRRRCDIQADNEGSIAPYLYTALKYRIISYYAYTASEIRRMNMFGSEEHIPSFNSLEIKELKEVIEVEVCKLPGRMQQIFRLSREEDISIHDIAVQLNLSEQTVKNQLTTALKRLRRQLSEKKVTDFALILLMLVHF